jgi:hypothetical protein
MYQASGKSMMAHVEDSSNVADTLSSHSVFGTNGYGAGFNAGNNFLVN